MGAVFAELLTQSRALKAAANFKNEGPAIAFRG
jgi:hypothetical protein